MAEKKKSTKKAGQKISLNMLQRHITWVAVQQPSLDEINENTKQPDTSVTAKVFYVYNKLRIDEVESHIREVTDDSAPGAKMVNFPDDEEVFAVRAGMMEWIQKKLREANLTGQPVGTVMNALDVWGVKFEYSDLFGDDDEFDEDTEFIEDDDTPTAVAPESEA